MVVPFKKKLSKRHSKQDTESGDQSAQIMDLFRKNFESQFGSIETGPIQSSKTKKFKSVEELDSDASENSDLGSSHSDSSFISAGEGESRDQASKKVTNAGSNSRTTLISSQNDLDQDSDGPQIVKFSGGSNQSDSVDDFMTVLSKKQQRKLFMSAKAPKSIDQAQLNAQSKIPESSESQEDLKNDLELNRLIKESQILAEAEKQSSHYSGADLSLDAEYNPKVRLKVLEMRLNEVGSKGKRSDMPMNIRKGIVAKKHEKQAKYDEYAREAGIVQARKSRGDSNKSQKRRQRGLQIQTVGKSTRHGHVVSSREIAARTAKRNDRRKKRRS